MEENSNSNMNQDKPENKKMPVGLKRLLITAVCLTLLVGGGNIYASTQGYDNIFFLIVEKLGISQDVFGKEEILSDRDITISYRPIEIAKGTQIQVNSLVIKDNEAKLKMHVNEPNAQESITPLKYVVKDENGTELYSNVENNSTTLYGDVNCDGKVTKEDSDFLLRHLAGKEELSEQGKINADVKADGVLNNRDAVTILHYLDKWEGYETLPYIPEKSTSNAESQYKEELILNGFKEDTKKLILEIYNSNSQKIVDLEINLETKEINVIGAVEEVTKISEEELKQYLGAFAILTYKENTEYGDFTKETIEAENVRKLMTAVKVAELKNIKIIKNINGPIYSFDRDKINNIIESFTTLNLDESGFLKLDNEEFKCGANTKYNQYEIVDKLQLEPTCLEVINIDYIGGIYNVTFRFCYSTEANKAFESEINIEDLPVYEMSMGLILDEDNEYSKYKVSTMSEAVLVEENKIDKEEVLEENSNDEQAANTITEAKKLQIASYVAEKNSDEEFGGVVTLEKDNKCMIYYGSMTGDLFYGNYKIEGTTLICELTKLSGEYINDLEIDIKYYFDIIDSENIEFREVVGSVGKYYCTLPGENGEPQGEYEFREEWHFSKGEKFKIEKVNKDESVDVTEDSREVKESLTPSGFAGSSLKRVVLYSDNTVCILFYDGSGYEEENIYLVKLIARNVDKIEYNGQGEKFESIIVQGKNIEIVEDAYGWIEFRKNNIKDELTEYLTNINNNTNSDLEIIFNQKENGKEDYKYVQKNILFKVCSIIVESEVEKYRNLSYTELCNYNIEYGNKSKSRYIIMFMYNGFQTSISADSYDSNDLLVTTRDENDEYRIYKLELNSNALDLLRDLYQNNNYDR